MTQNVKIIQGTYRNAPITDTVFPLVKPIQYGKKGMFVTVDASKVLDPSKKAIRVLVDSADDVTYIPSADMPATAEAPVKEEKVETEEEALDRIKRRFEILDEMTDAVANGTVRGLIVSGPPGVGKSHGVEKVLGNHELIAQLGNKPAKYEVVKGAMSAIGLYCKLYKHADKDNVLVFDDCDSVFSDELSLNILKAALDSKRTRKICWNTDSFKLRNEGVPDSFDFKGSAIFITNIKFDNVKSKKMRDHLEALESRCHYIDLTIDTDREKMLRIKQITKDGMLNDYQLGEHVENDIVDFMEANKNKLRELSLRTVLKVADLAKAFPDRWEAMAENTVMRRA